MGEQLVAHFWRSDPVDGRQLDANVGGEAEFGISDASQQFGTGNDIDLYAAIKGDNDGWFNSRLDNGAGRNAEVYCHVDPGNFGDPISGFEYSNLSRVQNGDFLSRVDTIQLIRLDVTFFIPRGLSPNVQSDSHVL